MDLDSILNDALDELTLDEEQNHKVDVKQELSSAAKSTAQKQEANAQEVKANDGNSAGEDPLAAMMKNLFGDQDFEKVLDEAFKDLDLGDLMQKLQSGEGFDGADDPELANMMKLLSGGAGTNPDGTPAVPNPEMMEKIVSKLESEMGEEKINSFMEQMMKTMMSKDIMYKPVVAVTEEYPKFLSKKGITSEDRARYEQQFAGYKALRETFEQEPENYDKISKIMNDLQAFGKPPEPILQLMTPEGAPGGDNAQLPPGCPQQ